MRSTKRTNHPPPHNAQALLVHDTDTDKAAAAMDVGVGSLFDGDVEGCAHFCEHMLFLGGCVSGWFGWMGGRMGSGKGVGRERGLLACIPTRLAHPHS